MHKQTYTDLYPQTKPRREWGYAVATIAVFAAIGVMLALRG